MIEKFRRCRSFGAEISFTGGAGRVSGYLYNPLSFQMHQYLANTMAHPA
jgi:hypothetical protein